MKIQNLSHLETQNSIWTSYPRNKRYHPQMTFCSTKKCLCFSRLRTGLTTTLRNSCTRQPAWLLTREWWWMTLSKSDLNNKRLPSLVKHRIQGSSNPHKALGFNLARTLQVSTSRWSFSKSKPWWDNLSKTKAARSKTRIATTISPICLTKEMSHLLNSLLSTSIKTSITISSLAIQILQGVVTWTNPCTRPSQTFKTLTRACLLSSMRLSTRQQHSHKVPSLSNLEHKTLATHTSRRCLNRWLIRWINSQVWLPISNKDKSTCLNHRLAMARETIHKATWPMVRFHIHTKRTCNF